MYRLYGTKCKCGGLFNFAIGIVKRKNGGTVKCEKCNYYARNFQDKLNEQWPNAKRIPVAGERRD